LYYITQTLWLEHWMVQEVMITTPV